MLLLGSVERGCSHEEDTIGKPRQGVNLAIAIWKPRIGGPFAHHGSAKSNNESKAIEEHVNTITEQTERARDEAV